MLTTKRFILDDKSKGLMKSFSRSVRHTIAYMFLPSSVDCRIIAATHTTSCGDMAAAACCYAALLEWCWNDGSSWQVSNNSDCCCSTGFVLGSPLDHGVSSFNEQVTLS
jgi:hypothetical protein